MSARWLGSILLFALGFATAFLIRLPVADATAIQGAVGGNLKYVEGDKDFQFVYPPGQDTSPYLVIGTRKPGTVKGPAPLVSFQTGRLSVAKQNLVSLTICEVKPLLLLKEGRGIRCDQAYCPLPPEPLPPGPPLQPKPPITIPPDFFYNFLKAGPDAPRPGH